LREEKITNEEIKWVFYKIPEIEDAFIMKKNPTEQMNKHSNRNFLEHGSTPPTRPQLSCNNSFYDALSAFLPEYQQKTTVAY